MSECKSRINYIDFLKFIGLSGIIMAHVKPPQWMLMLRGFDVVLMVIVSSILAEKSFSKYSNNNSNARDYYYSRIKRLIIPTWIFLTMYFTAEFVFGGNNYGIKYYIKSFCFTRYGIGFVWIILIYLYSALLIPLFSKMNNNSKSVLIIIALYFVFELMYLFKVGINNKLLDTTFYYIIPYGTLTYIGYNYRNMEDRKKYLLTFVSSIIFVICGIFYYIKTGSPQTVYIAKYPPRLYYISYGIMWTLFLFKICEKNKLKIFDNIIIRYISIHSMWIYLYHIAVLKIYELAGWPNFWILKFFIIYIMSILIVVIVNIVLNFLDGDNKLYLTRYLR